MKLSSLACAMVAILACAACSPQGAPPAAPADDASAAMPAPAGTSASASHGAASPGAAQVYLFDLLKRPDFASALDDLAGARALPAWVRGGGTATPARTVQVEGRPMLLASACKPHDCPGERVALLYDAAGHAMWGLYAQRPADLSPPVDPDDDSHDTLTWLGHPDPQRQQLLHDALYPR
ncbi:Ivy family c-type lysozyme inhibitor [Fulvimonas sp. R45]|uniref:Ivy family c-type lysozyme inhibitor n=1 Tax=Fulvimonas sp. R45 TaxID=3045937 RepID=UPI00265F6AA9|nr:Ivy family c-type lysozyme inhibitor [Fulvimonas sp. R45]MDO1527476.1 Ivy family c-type lysozyme inhibitor [Fulvimonas sp. R45]